MIREGLKSINIPFINNDSHIVPILVDGPLECKIHRLHIHHVHSSRSNLGFLFVIQVNQTKNTDDNSNGYQGENQNIVNGTIIQASMIDFQVVDFRFDVIGFELWCA